MNEKLHTRSAATAFAWCLLSIQQTATAHTAPVGDPAYPPFGSCQSAAVPELPPAWQANALLTPYQSQPLRVARVASATFGSNPTSMVVTTNTLQGDNLQSWYINGDRTFRLGTDSSGNLSCELDNNTPTSWIAPAPNWLAEADCQCAGSNLVTGTEAEAWRCPNGMNEGNGPEYDWFWFTQDENQFPHRILNSRSNNTQSLPVLGDASMVHFEGFTDTADSFLHAAHLACDLGYQTRADIPDPQIPGLSYNATNAPPPPTWPNTAFANGALFAVDGEYTGMAIYYDWNSRQEVSKIKSSVDGSIQDTRLTPGITYEMSYPDGPNAAPHCDGTLVNVGIWHPDWPTTDGCEYRATIDAHSPLNPLHTPLQAMACYFGGSGPEASNIQAWYSFDEKPVMFYETNAGDLDLIDYYQWIPDATIPAGVLYPIDSCPGGSEQVFQQCNACHGRN